MTLFDADTLAEFPRVDSIIYLTGVSIEETRNANRFDVGYLATPESDKRATRSAFYEYHAADNGCYNSSKPGRSFNPDAWLAWLAQVELRGCLFAALPDVLNWIEDPDTGKLFPVGDWQATIARSALYVDQVKSMGFPAAMVMQDGMRSIDEIPFEVDALFIGGSDDFKLGEQAAEIVDDAKSRGMWVHMGRVNSAKRLAYAASIGCDSADGTFLKFCRKDQQARQYRRMISWLDKVQEATR